MSEPFVLDASFSTLRAESFTNDAVGRLVQNAVTGTGADTVSLDRTLVNSVDETTSQRLDSWKVTDQKHSGRCWEFAGLNVLRAKVIDELKVDDFQFSQNYIAFFDKLEKANHTLSRATATASRDASEEEVRSIMDYPSEDGGWWFQFTDIVAKYGLVPSRAMPDTESAGNTAQMNQALATVLRRAIGRIREAATNSDPAEGSAHMEAVRNEALNAVWRILAIHLGTPPTSFMWQYRDKDKNFHRKGTYTPLKYAHEIVPQAFDPWVALAHDRAKNTRWAAPTSTSTPRTWRVAPHIGICRWALISLRRPLSSQLLTVSRCGSPAMSRSNSTKTWASGMRSCMTTRPSTASTWTCRRLKGCGCVNPVALTP